MFDSVLGQTNAKLELKYAIENNTVSHAYLFFGAKGIGKETMAREFAKELLQVDNLEVCPDYIQLEKLEGKKEISIEQIRKKIVEDIYIKPAMSNYKVYVVNNADTMQESYQNVLLKTLEEPPENVVIILIVQNMYKILPTILSRVQKVALYRVPDDVIREHIKEKYNVELSDEQLNIIDGRISRAEEIVNEKKEKYYNIQELVKKIKTNDMFVVLEAIQQVDLKEEENIDMLVKLCITEGMFKKIPEIEKAHTKLMANTNEEMVKTMLAMRLVK